MLRTAASIVLAGLAVSNTAATAAGFQWSIIEIAGKKQLAGLNQANGDDGVDTLFRVGCKPAGKIELGIGADVSVGKGENEAVTLTAVSNKTVLKVDGVSRKSGNFEMTGTSELIRETGFDDPVVQLMIKTKSVTFRGVSVQRFTVPAIGFHAQLEKLRNICDKAG